MQFVLDIRNSNQQYGLMVIPKWMHVARSKRPLSLPCVDSDVEKPLSHFFALALSDDHVRWTRWYNGDEQTPSAVFIKIVRWDRNLLLLNRAVAQSCWGHHNDGPSTIVFVAHWSDYRPLCGHLGTWRLLVIGQSLEWPPLNWADDNYTAVCLDKLSEVKEFMSIF